MAAPVANDRKLGANVRRLALLEVQKILLGDDEVAKKEMVFKLAPNLMPRLHEGAGDNGEIVIQTITGTRIIQDGTTFQDQDTPTSPSSQSVE